MLQSINKKKLYLYLFFFIFLSSIFNFEFLENYQNKFSLKKINIEGLSYNEKKMIEIKLNKFKMINIFRLSEEKILKTLNDFKFLENIYINKVIPSTININLSKTNIIGKTTRNGKKFYIGENENFINSDQVSENINIPSIFGDFKIKEFIELQTILSVHQIDLKMIKKYYFYKNKRWDLFFHNGITLMLPSKNVQQSLKIFNKLLYNGNLANVRIIDLRVRNQVILTNYDE